MFAWFEVVGKYAFGEGGVRRTARSNMPGFFAALKSLPWATLAYA
jgi:hypothetical protein